jgi:hypothetical protein
LTMNDRICTKQVSKPVGGVGDILPQYGFSATMYSTGREPDYDYEHAHEHEK